jgi:hypothetical protein
MRRPRMATLATPGHPARLQTIRDGRAMVTRRSRSTWRSWASLASRLTRRAKPSRARCFRAWRRPIHAVKPTPMLSEHDSVGD